MLSYFSRWIFWLYIVNTVYRTHTVRIFENTAAQPTTLFTIYRQSVRSKTCMLKPEYGPCRSKIRMWYYKPESWNCSTFYWGGCQGNGNRFDSLDECRDFCLTKPGMNIKYRPRYCSLTFDYGFCFGAIERYYYDPLWKVCKSTLYSGCGGNQNNFYERQQCENICRFGTGARSTQRVVTGGSRKVVIINPINTSPGRAGTVETTPSSSLVPALKKK